MVSGWVSGMRERIRWPGSFLWERASAASPGCAFAPESPTPQPFSCEAGGEPAPAKAGVARSAGRGRECSELLLLFSPCHPPKSKAALRCARAPSSALRAPSPVNARRAVFPRVPRCCRATLDPPASQPQPQLQLQFQPQATSHKPQATSPKPQATSHKPQATDTMPTPPDRSALTAALPPLPEADARTIETFLRSEEHTPKPTSYIHTSYPDLC